MHQSSARDRTAEMLANRLVAEAHAEQRLARIRTGRDEVETDAGLVRRARAGGNQKACCLGPDCIGCRQGVVTLDLNLDTEFHQVMDKVEGEAVVIVDD